MLRRFMLYSLCGAFALVGGRRTRPACPVLKKPSGQVGIASWYGSRFHGRPTASGRRFDRRALTCAHRTLPLGSKVRVENLTTGRSVVLLVNDRGPYFPGRVIDLSERAAEVLGMKALGVAEVRIVRVG